MRAAVIALVAAGCGRSEPAPALDNYLANLLTTDMASREAAVRSWKLDRTAWERLTTDPYRAQYSAYTRAFDAEVPELVRRLTRSQPVSTRAHFAGDPKLTLGQARARWAQPVQAPSELAEIGGAPLDVVFVKDGEAYRAIVGVERIILDAAAPLNPDCAALLGKVSPKPCEDALWPVAEAALRGERARFDRACGLAASACR